MLQPRFVYPAFAVLFAILVFTQIKGCFTDDEPSAGVIRKGTPENGAPVPLPAQPVTSAPTAKPAPAQPTTPSVPGAIPVDPKLAKAVSAFVRAHYLIKSSDTTKTRRNRMTRLVPAQHLKSLNLVVKQKTDLTQRGNPLVEQLQASILNDNERFVEVKLPVEITFVDPNGKVVANEADISVSRWKFARGRWVFHGIGPVGVAAP